MDAGNERFEVFILCELGGLLDDVVVDKKSDKYAQQAFEKTDCRGVLGIYFSERDSSFAKECHIFDPQIILCKKVD